MSIAALILGILAVIVGIGLFGKIVAFSIFVSLWIYIGGLFLIITGIMSLFSDGSTASKGAGGLGIVLGILYMNTALQTGQGEVLRDLYTLTDKYRDPQALILAYDNAYRIGEAIVSYGNDPYLRARAAALEAGAIINEAVDAKKMYLTRFERDSLDSALKILEALPTEVEQFTDDCIRRYSRKVSEFDPKSYEL